MSGLRELLAGVHDGQWVGGMRWDYAALLAGFPVPLCPNAHKAAHATRAGAQAELDHLRERRRLRGRPVPDATLTTYLCECQAWHIGNHAERPLGGPAIPSPRRRSRP